MSKVGLSGSIETFDRASGGPDAPISIFWTRAFGPDLTGVQESRTKPWTVRSAPIREIPANSGSHVTLSEVFSTEAEVYRR